MYNILAPTSCTGGQKRKREEVKKTAKEYFDRIAKLPRLEHNVPASVPVGPTFSADAFELINRQAFLIHRENLSREWDDFLAKHPRSPVLYIQGPQGIGKSHLIFQKVMDLRLDSTNRVIYVPGT